MANESRRRLLFTMVPVHSRLVCLTKDAACLFHACTMEVHDDGSKYDGSLEHGSFPV